MFCLVCVLVVVLVNVWFTRFSYLSTPVLCASCLGPAGRTARAPTMAASDASASAGAAVTASALAAPLVGETRLSQDDIIKEERKHTKARQVDTFALRLFFVRGLLRPLNYVCKKQKTASEQNVRLFVFLCLFSNIIGRLLMG